MTPPRTLHNKHLRHNFGTNVVWKTGVTWQSAIYAIRANGASEMNGGRWLLLVSVVHAVTAIAASVAR